MCFLLNAGKTGCQFYVTQGGWHLLDATNKVTVLFKVNCKP